MLTVSILTARCRDEAARSRWEISGYTALLLMSPVPRATTVNFVLSRVPAASFFAVRAWRLNGKPLWLPIVVIPCLYVPFLTYHPVRVVHGGLIHPAVMAR